MRTFIVVSLAVLILAAISGDFATSNRLSAQGKQSRAQSKLERFHKQHDELHREFAKRLETLAQFCDENGLAVEAGEIRQSAAPVERDVLQMAPLPRQVRLELPADLPATERQWRARLRNLQENYARDLYAVARRALSDGHVTFATDLIREVASQDSDHRAARRMLGYVQHGNEWVSPFAAEMLKKRNIWTSEYGWVPQDHLARYQAGERYYRRRWMSELQEAEIRRDFEQAWEVRTEHYLIRTNHSLQVGVELGQRLEEFYRVFFHTFAGFFNTGEQIRTLLDGARSRPTVTSRPFIVHYYRTRDEYNQRLRKKITQPIEITTGLYISADRVAHFFHDPDADPASHFTTIYHEATHQLFSETRSSNQPVGIHGNFWLIEGIACYMESFESDDTRFRLGNPEYVRFQAARYRFDKDKYYIPLEKFASMGMSDFQSDPNISRNYSQAAGLTHFFMHARNAELRELLINHLSDIYSTSARTRQKPRTLEELGDFTYAEFDQMYAAHVTALPEAGLFPEEPASP